MSTPENPRPAFGAATGSAMVESALAWADQLTYRDGKVPALAAEVRRLRANIAATDAYLATRKDACLSRDCGYNGGKTYGRRCHDCPQDEAEEVECRLHPDESPNDKMSGRAETEGGQK